MLLGVSNGTPIHQSRSWCRCRLLHGLSARNFLAVLCSKPRSHIAYNAMLRATEIACPLISPWLAGWLHKLHHLHVNVDIRRTCHAVWTRPRRRAGNTSSGQSILAASSGERDELGSWQSKRLGQADSSAASFASMGWI